MWSGVRLVLSCSDVSNNSLFLTTTSASLVGMQVKRDVTSKETIVSSASNCRCLILFEKPCELIVWCSEWPTNGVKIGGVGLALASATVTLSLSSSASFPDNLLFLMADSVAVMRSTVGICFGAAAKFSLFFKNLIFSLGENSVREVLYPSVPSG